MNLNNDNHSFIKYIFIYLMTREILIRVKIYIVIFQVLLNGCLKNDLQLN